MSNEIYSQSEMTNDGFKKTRERYSWFLSVKKGLRVQEFNGSREKGDRIKNKNVNPDSRAKSIGGSKGSRYEKPLPQKMEV
jgi:hypothetical protein